MDIDLGDSDYKFLFKFILIGDSGVGKSCLMTQFSQLQFISTHQLTVGVDFGSRVIDTEGFPVTKVQIWDTAGQEVFRSIALSYFRNAIGGILVYDITRRSSFDHLDRWLDDARKHCNTDCVFWLIGNKCDLSDERIISKEEAKDFAKSNNLMFMETSAKNAYNVQEAFTNLVKEVHDRIQNGIIDLKCQVPGIILGPNTEKHEDPLRRRNKVKNKCCNR